MKNKDPGTNVFICVCAVILTFASMALIWALLISANALVGSGY